MNEASMRMKKVMFIFLLIVLGGCVASPDASEDPQGSSDTAHIASADTVEVNSAPFVWGDWSVIAPSVSTPVSVQSDAAIAISIDTGRRHVFYVGGADRQLVHAWRADGGAWAYEMLGNFDGPLQSGPAAVAWETPPGVDGSIRRGISVVVRNSRNNVLYRQLEGATWTPWQNIQGGITDRPAIAYTRWYGGGIPYLAVFARSSDNHLWWNTSIGTLGRFGGWAKVSDYPIYSAPGVVSMGNDRFDVFARSATASVVQTYWSGYDGSWTYVNNWASIGGTTLQGAPGVASARTGALDIFVQGTDRSLDEISWTGSRWTNWSMIADCMWHQPETATENTHWSGSTPAVAGYYGGLDLVIRGNDGNLWYRQRGLTRRTNNVAPPACPCGHGGQECCVFASCNNDAHLICNPAPAPGPRNVCQACGTAGVQCCPGSTCDGGLACDRNQCVPCGGAGQTCCSAGPACSSGVACTGGRCPQCGAGVSCPGGQACQNGQCVRCGHAGEPCCFGTDRVCGGDSDADNATLQCNNGTCESCGYNGLKCCTLNHLYCPGRNGNNSEFDCRNNVCVPHATAAPVCGSSGQACPLGTTCIGSTCRPCGTAGLPCCDNPLAPLLGGQCAFTLACHPDTHTCGACGTLGNLCCETSGGSWCAAPLNCPRDPLLARRTCS